MRKTASTAGFVIQNKTTGGYVRRYFAGHWKDDYPLEKAQVFSTKKAAEDFIHNDTSEANFVKTGGLVPDNFFTQTAHRELPAIAYRASTQYSIKRIRSTVRCV